MVRSYTDQPVGGCPVGSDVASGASPVVGATSGSPAHAESASALETSALRIVRTIVSVPPEGWIAVTTLVLQGVPRRVRGWAPRPTTR